MFLGVISRVIYTQIRVPPARAICSIRLTHSDFCGPFMCPEMSSKYLMSELFLLWGRNAQGASMLTPRSQAEHQIYPASAPDPRSGGVKGGREKLGWVKCGKEFLSEALTPRKRRSLEVYVYVDV